MSKGTEHPAFAASRLATLPSQGAEATHNRLGDQPRPSSHLWLEKQKLIPSSPILIPRSQGDSLNFDFCIILLFSYFTILAAR